MAHIIGNGKGDSETNRSNAHTVDFNGNGWFAGDLYVGGEYAFYHNYKGAFVTKGDVQKVATEKHVGKEISKAIADVATKEYVDSAIQTAIETAITSVLTTEV